MTFVLLLLALVALLLLAVPVSFALLGATLLALVSIGGISPTIIAQQLLAGIDSVLLLAIPFFLLAGGLMTAGGMTDRLLALTNAVLGRFRGGLAMSNVASATLMAGISGSAVADTSALGRVLIPAMIKSGYAPGFAAALTASANLVGPIIPPSITFVIIGLLTGLSVTRLFLAGVVPGLLFAAVLFWLAGYISRRRGYPVHGRASWREIGRALRAASWALLLPLLIVVGVRSGVFNVTECSAVAVVYALVVGAFIHRELTGAKILRTLIETARLTAVLLLVLGSAQAVSWLLAYQNLPHQLATWLLEATTHPLVFLLLVNVLLLLIGTFLENSPALVMLAPVLYPIAAKLGIDPIHFSMVIALNLLLGLITPPVAVSLALSALIAKVPAREVTREVAPFFLAALCVLALVTLVPALSLWLPSLLLSG